jgi:biopolymer transport protein ExbD
MSLRTRCTNCLEDFVVHERFRGKKIKCPHCGEETAVVHIPSLSAKLDDPELEQFSDPGNINTRAVSITTTGLSDDTNLAVTDMAPPASKGKRIPLKKDSGGGEEDLEWDITPMVDVTFLLLIFFMITASFTIQKVIRTPMQPTDGKAATSQPRFELTEEIKILVDEFNTYSVVNVDGGVEFAGNRSQLVGMLNRMRGDVDMETVKVSIEAHIDSNHGGVVGALDAAREAGFSRFKMNTVEEFSV